MKRVTEKELNIAIERLNIAKGENPQPVTDRKWNVGTYFLAAAYGGYKLARIVNENGGQTDITSGYRPKREVLNTVLAMLNVLS